MSAPLPSRLTVGAGALARDIAIEARSGATPGLFWLGGFRSVMMGSKAMALDALGQERGLTVTRFDYSGHGVSGGDFNHGTISRWLEEAQAVLATTTGPQIIVGSSMGGWIALLLARALLKAGTPARGLVLIAPAPDMTHELMGPGFTLEEHQALQAHGFVEQPSAYSEQPYRINQSLLDDGEQHLLFGSVIETGCPVTILQGGQDEDVPPSHAIRLVTHLLHDPVTLTMIPDGDHRLSRPQDLDRLKDAVLRLVDAK